MVRWEENHVTCHNEEQYKAGGGCVPGVGSPGECHQMAVLSDKQPSQAFSILQAGMEQMEILDTMQ